MPKDVERGLQLAHVGAVVIVLNGIPMHKPTKFARGSTRRWCIPGRMVCLGTREGGVAPRLHAVRGLPRVAAGGPRRRRRTPGVGQHAPLGNRNNDGGASPLALRGPRTLLGPLRMRGQ